MAFRSTWPGDWDAVLVDSRFRVACALKSFLATAGVVLVHDYGNRKRSFKDCVGLLHEALKR